MPSILRIDYSFSDFQTTPNSTLTFLLLSLFLGLPTYLFSQCASNSNIYSFSYNCTNYEVITQTKSWTNAAACAVQRGGHLVHINSQQEQDSVYDAIINGAGVSSTYTSVSDGGGIAYVWIGGSDIDTEGTWLWDGDNDSVGTNFWNGNSTGSAASGSFVFWGGTYDNDLNEPDNYFNQDAAAIGLANWPNLFNPPYGVAGEWNDISITNLLYFVVELGPTLIDTTICSGDSLFAGGEWQSTNGTYYDTITLSNSCDSFIITEVAVAPNWNIQDTIELCEGDSVFLGGTYQYQSGIYTDVYATVNGCDSIIETYLTVNPTLEGSDNEEICEGDSILLGGSYQSTPGIYTDVFTAETGCDSIVHTTLNVNASPTLENTAEICFGDSILLGGQYQTSSGTYSDVYTTSSGCDSTVKTVLTVNQPDTNWMSIDDTLIANDQEAEAYLWIDCETGNAIEGADEYLYVTPSIGEFALVITQNGCTDSSSCRSVTDITNGIESLKKSASFSIYPNPITDNLLIVRNNQNAEEVHLEIMDTHGRRALKATMSGPTKELNLEYLDSGVYYLIFQYQLGREVEKLLILE